MRFTHDPQHIQAIALRFSLHAQAVEYEAARVESESISTRMALRTREDQDSAGEAAKQVNRAFRNIGQLLREMHQALADRANELA